MKTFKDVHNYDNVVISTKREKTIFPQFFWIRFFLCIIGIVIFLFVASSCTQKIDENNAAITIENDLPGPEWVNQYPIAFVGNWDREELFNTRRSVNPIGWEVSYKRNMEEKVIKLKEMGITMAITHFFKGFGIEAEKESMEDTKKFATLCKKHE